MTALQAAAFQGAHKIVQRLLEGKTALDYAEVDHAEAYQETVRLLRAAQKKDNHE